MSRKGNFYDKAAIESFWSSLNLELIYRHEFVARQKFRMAIFDLMERFYYSRRIHSALNYLSPDDFERKYN